MGDSRRTNEFREAGLEEAATALEEAWIEGGAVETVCDLHHVVGQIRTLKAKPTQPDAVPATLAESGQSDGGVD